MYYVNEKVCRSTLLNSVHFFLKEQTKLKIPSRILSPYTCLNDVYKNLFDKNIKSFLSFENNNFDQDRKSEIIFD